MFYSNDKFSQQNQIINDDELSSSTDSSQPSRKSENMLVPTIKLRIHWLVHQYDLFIDNN